MSEGGSGISNQPPQNPAENLTEITAPPAVTENVPPTGPAVEAPPLDVPPAAEPPLAPSGETLVQPLDENTSAVIVNQPQTAEFQQPALGAANTSGDQEADAIKAPEADLTGQSTEPTETTETAQPTQPEEPAEPAAEDPFTKWKEEHLTEWMKQENFSDENQKILEVQPTEKLRMMILLIQGGFYAQEDTSKLAACTEEDLKNVYVYLQVLKTNSDKLKAELAQTGQPIPAESAAQPAEDPKDVLKKRSQEIAEKAKQPTDAADAEKLKTEQADLAERQAKLTELMKLSKNGEYRTQFKDLLRPNIEKKVDQELDAELLKVALAERARIEALDPTEREKEKFVDGQGEVLSEEKFVEAFFADAKDPKRNPDFEKKRQEKIQQKIEEEVEAVFGKEAAEAPKTEEVIEKLAEADPTVREKFDNLMKSLPGKLRKEAAESPDRVIKTAFDNDFMTFLRFMMHADASFQVGRGGAFGLDKDGKLVRLMGKEDLMAKAKRPMEFASAIMYALTNNRTMIEAGFKVPAEALKKSVDGDPEALREVMNELMSHLFHGTAGEQAEHWEAFRQGIPEALFPGMKVGFDDEMLKFFQNLHDDMRSKGNMFELMFVREGSGKSSKDAKAATTKPPATPIPAPKPAPSTAPVAAAA